MSSIDYFYGRAMLYRRLAKHILDRSATEALNAMADEYEEKAKLAEDKSEVGVNDNTKGQDNTEASAV